MDVVFVVNVVHFCKRRDLKSLQEIYGRFERAEPKYLRIRMDAPALAYVLSRYQRGEDPEEFGDFRPLLAEYRELVGQDPDPFREKDDGDEDDFPF